MGLSGTQSYILSRKNITSALSGIDDIELVGERTLSFVTKDGEEFRVTVPTPELVYISDTEPSADSEYQLWIDTSDQGTTPINRAILSEDIVSNITIGSVAPGSQFKVGDSLEDVIRQMLTLKTKPKITLGISPATTIYDVTVDTLEKLTISGNVTPGSAMVKTVKFYIDNKLVKTIDEDISAVKLVKYEHTFDAPQKKTFVVRVEAIDADGQSGSAQTTINFVGKSYYGFVSETVITPTEADILGLQNNVLKIKKDLSYTEIPIPQDGDLYKILYAYPEELTAISKIVDADGRDYTASYASGNIKVNDINYLYYILIDGTGTAGATQKFS